jgi:hypothetical protein
VRSIWLRLNYGGEGNRRRLELEVALSQTLMMMLDVDVLGLNVDFSNANVDFSNVV